MNIFYHRKKVHFLPIYTRRYIFFIMINEYNVKCPCLHSKTISFRFHPKNIRQLVNEKKNVCGVKERPPPKNKKGKEKKRNACTMMKRVYFPKISKQVLLFQIQKHFNIISHNNVRKDIRHLPISNASYFTTRYTIWCIILSTVVLLGKLQMMSRTLDEVKNFTPVFLWGFVN